MTTVADSRKIVTSIMTFELLESTELDYIDFWCIYRGGSRVSGKVVNLIFLKYPMKISHENEIIWPH